jgi:hypothetical protein
MKNANPQIAHLFFAYTQDSSLKKQKSYFGQTQVHVILFEYYKDNINKTGILTILQC